MAVKFRGVWLESFYEQGVGHRKISAVLSSTLYRKVQVLDAASQEFDLRIPPCNRFEYLQAISQVIARFVSTSTIDSSFDGRQGLPIKHI